MNNFGARVRLLRPGSTKGTTVCLQEDARDAVRLQRHHRSPGLEVLVTFESRTPAKTTLSLPGTSDRSGVVFMTS
jgi:hypothetical protein